MSGELDVLRAVSNSDIADELEWPELRKPSNFLYFASPSLTS